MQVLKKQFQKTKGCQMKKSDSLQIRELLMDGVGEPAQALLLDSEVCLLVFVSFCGMSSLFCIYL